MAREGAMGGATPRSRVGPWTMGFVVFAGAMMIMGGIFQFIQGLAAVIQDDFFVLTRNYAFDLDVTSWGWVHMITGIVVMLAGFYVFTGNLAARMLGIAIAIISGIINFFYIPYYPVWSLLIIAIDIGVVWALATYDTGDASDLVG
ncbi:MAG: hypothetical protein AB7P33_09090 [Dehalococcoidia bacterium]